MCPLCFVIIFAILNIAYGKQQGKQCTLIDSTTLGGEKFDLGPKPLPRPCPITISQDATRQNEVIVESAVENARFQGNVRGFSKRHLCRCKDHRALTVGEKISDRMDFLDANCLRVENGQNPCVLP